MSGSAQPSLCPLDANCSSTIDPAALEKRHAHSHGGRIIKTLGFYVAKAVSQGLWAKFESREKMDEYALSTHFQKCQEREGADVVKEWLENHKDEIELFFLSPAPYSPELNPDE